MDSTKIKTLCNEGSKSKILRFVDYVGIQCDTTICKYDPKSTPYFFLFADLDIVDREKLRLTLQLYAQAKLSFYWYQTAKGYHIVSPCLLPLKQWDRLRTRLATILDNYYRNLVIRVENKEGDSSQVNYSDFNDKVYDESITLHQLFRKRFNQKFHVSGVRTNINFCKYSQLRLEF